MAIFILPLAALIGCAAQPITTRERSNNAAPIMKDLGSGHISCIVVHSLPADVVTVITVSCDSLATFGNWGNMSTNCEAAVRLDLLKALANTKLRSTKLPGDMRWRADLLDENGRQLHTICLAPYDIGSDVAALDGVSFSVNSALRKWFKRDFPQGR
jgi:hypothetical protein